MLALQKDCAFYEAVKHFLQSNRIQEVCPWHLRPESPLFFNYHEMQLSCARKPMFAYTTLTSDYQVYWCESFSILFYYWVKL